MLNDRNEKYLTFIRERLCAFCGHRPVDAHHSIKHIRGLSVAALGHKGSDYLAVPLCRQCHERMHSGNLRPARVELLEVIVSCLISYAQGLAG